MILRRAMVVDMIEHSMTKTKYCKSRAKSALKVGTGHLSVKEIP